MAGKKKSKKAINGHDGPKDLREAAQMAANARVIKSDQDVEEIRKSVELPVPLSEEEARVDMQAITANLGRIELVKGLMKPHTDEIKKLNKDNQERQRRVNSKTTMALVDCVEIWNYRTFDVTLTRAGTGEVIKLVEQPNPRPMTEKERSGQRNMVDAPPEDAEQAEDGDADQPDA